METEIASNDYLHAASEGTRQRAREQRVRLAAPEQRGHFFNSFFKLSTISFYMGQQLEIFGLLLLLPRARRALARAETRAHTAAAHARALRCPSACMRPMCRVLLYVCTRAPSRAWHAVCSVQARYAAWHAHSVFFNTNSVAFATNSVAFATT